GLVTSTWSLLKEREARRRAVASEKQAQTAARRSQQVAEFLKKMLAGVSPSVALGRDTAMLREIADKTGQSISADLKDQPEVEIELRFTLATLYFDLDLWKEG